MIASITFNRGETLSTPLLFEALPLCWIPLKISNLAPIYDTENIVTLKLLYGCYMLIYFKGCSGEFENIVTLKLQRMLHAYLLLQVPPTVTTICQETNGSGKCETFSPYSQDNPSSSVVAPARISAKPSALRMPSPSVGFFTQVIYYALSYIFTNVASCFLSDMKIT